VTAPSPPDDGLLLAIDSATTQVVVAVGAVDGTPLEAAQWPAGYRHGETLLPAIDELLGRLDIGRSRLAAIVVGIGPGAFTGLRVGIATAKGLAHALGLPIIGISTADALLANAPARSILLLPAGPSDRLVARPGGPAMLLPAGTDPDVADGETLVAVDLGERAPANAVELGDLARRGLGVALLVLGAARFAAGDVDDLAELVPDYVTLPRGVKADGGEVAWSHDPR
jgi:tRNA threonylcarbamoyl adenosine modification protein YeaZ